MLAALTAASLLAAGCGSGEAGGTGGRASWVASSSPIHFHFGITRRTNAGTRFVRGTGSAQDFAEFIAAERRKWQAVADATGIRID